MFHRDKLCILTAAICTAAAIGSSSCRVKKLTKLLCERTISRSCGGLARRRTTGVRSMLNQRSALAADRASGSRTTWDARETGAPATELVQFISFTIGGDHYGVDIIAVREIKGWSEITRLPEQPDYMRGVLNLRGAIVPVVDLRCRFGQGMTEPTPLHVLIVVLIGQQLVGLLADTVSDIVAVDPAGIKPVPRVTQHEGAGILSGIATVDGNKMITLIDLDRLLTASDAEAAIASATAATPVAAP
jgi:purine-binding chemotaxis protein CheW